MLGLSFDSFCLAPAAVRSLRGEVCMQETWRKRRVLCRWTCLPLHYASIGVNDRLLLFFSRKDPLYSCLQRNKNKQIYDFMLSFVYVGLLTFYWNDHIGERLHSGKLVTTAYTVFLETVTGDPWEPLLWGQSKPPCVWSPQWTWKGAIVWGKQFSENFIKYKLCFGQADLLCGPVRRGISREQVFWVFFRINRETNITLHTHSKAA